MKKNGVQKNQLQKEIRELKRSLKQSTVLAQQEKRNLINKTHQLFILFSVSKKLQEKLTLGDELGLIARGILLARLFHRAIISLFDEDWNRVSVGYGGLTSEEIEAHKNSPPLAPEIWKAIFSPAYRISRSYYIRHDTELASRIKGLPSHIEADQFKGWHPNDMLFIPLKNKKGKILGVLSVDDPYDGLKPTDESLKVLELFAREAASIIERNQLYEDLAQAENYFEKLIQSSSDIIFSGNYDGNFVVFNRSAEKILGYQATDLKETPIAAIFASEKEAGEALGILNKEGQLRNKDTRMRTASGEIIPVSVSASLLYDEDNNLIGTEWIGKDLREILALQEKVIEMEKRMIVHKVIIGLTHRVNNYLQEIITLEKTLEDIFGAAKWQDNENINQEEVNDILTELRSSVLKIRDITKQLTDPSNKLEDVDYIGDLPMINIPEISVERTFKRVSALDKLCQGKKLLVADDDDIIRMGIARFLNKKGFEVDQAKDGREAIDKIHNNDYDLIVSDIKMPHKNGYDVFKAAKDKNSNTCVVLITAFGYDPDHAIVKAVKDGLKGIFLKEKPLEFEKLYEIIEKNLKGFIT
ncbi:response regulator [bacterium]|nr:response regulator [bacterium]